MNLLQKTRKINAMLQASAGKPVFYRGDIVVVEKANFLGISEFDPNDVQVGDIVVYIHAFLGIYLESSGSKFYLHGFLVYGFKESAPQCMAYLKYSTSYLI